MMKAISILLLVVVALSVAAVLIACFFALGGVELSESQWTAAFFLAMIGGVGGLVLILLEAEL